MPSDQNQDLLPEEQNTDDDDRESSTADVEDRESLSIRDRIIPFSALGILIILIGVFAYTLHSPSGSSLGAGGRVNTSGSMVQVDDQKAPEFTLQTFDGEEVSLADYRGQSVVINFWASWCPPCRDEAPMLNAFHEEVQGDDDVVLLGIAVWEEAEASIEFMRQYDLQFTNLSDEQGSVLIDYGVYGIPETFFIDADGMLVGKYRGPIESAEHIHELRTAFETGES